MNRFELDNSDDIRRHEFMDMNNNNHGRNEQCAFTMDNRN